eukprot:gnl/MRDRNA2_/MRDRNA2_84698_c0_seq1.p1 gnl/MRDRNA2_/MRDRNA2_84698_c0~~gnl/MRDRNA2_/MRDRNA2_84698_c0_seq1.p1  ORF type:complete len:751 (-),score=114.32 gnl/MRDRNA2_/MRDRNA2_84698_c0_seq1:250-2502(-)
MDCYDGLSITFPKRVKIENTRLTLLFYTLATAAVAFVGFNCWYSGGYLVFKQPEGRLQFWPTKWSIDDATANAINEAEAQADYCIAPEKYEFCADEECSWSAEGMTCLDICTAENFENCLESSERFTKTSGGLFFPTFFREFEIIYEPAGDDGTPAKRQTSSHTKVVKGVENMGIGFDHKYILDSPDGREQGGNQDSVLTVLQDASGREMDRWLPGNHVDLQLKEVLEYAGVDLSNVETKLGRNFLQGAHLEGVLTRLAGTEIFVEVSYHNKWTHNIPGWDGPVAILTIDSQPAWSSFPQLQVLDKHGSMRHRYYHGVRIHFVSKGEFAWVSMNQIIGALTSVLVFVRVAKKLIFYFTIKCLGLVSQVYDGFLNQRVSLDKECCSLAARLCSYTSTFVELKDKQNGISDARLHKRFKRIFGNARDLDDHEVVRFVDFVYSRMKLMGDCPESIDVEGFLKACSHGEALNVNKITGIFDANRRKTFMEKTFSGPALAKLFASDHLTRAQSENIQKVESDGVEACKDGPMVVGSNVEANPQPGEPANEAAIDLQLNITDTGQDTLDQSINLNASNPVQDEIDRDPNNSNTEQDEVDRDPNNSKHLVGDSSQIDYSATQRSLVLRLEKVESDLQVDRCELSAVQTGLTKLQTEHEELNQAVISMKTPGPWQHSERNTPRISEVQKQNGLSETQHHQCVSPSLNDTEDVLVSARRPPKASDSKGDPGNNELKNGRSSAGRTGEDSRQDNMCCGGR